MKQYIFCTTSHFMLTVYMFYSLVHLHNILAYEQVTHTTQFCFTRFKSVRFKHRSIYFEIFCCASFILNAFICCLVVVGIVADLNVVLLKRKFIARHAQQQLRSSASRYVLGHLLWPKNNQPIKNTKHVN